MNELISQAIQLVGDLTAMIPFVPPMGGVADAVLKPLYCVKGDTIIDGPDGGERIDILAERGTPFRVWSVTPAGDRVAANATHAFKKGSAELFEYTLGNGRTLTATKHHRWLTRSGWLEAGQTVIGADVATISYSVPEMESDAPSENLPDSAWSAIGDGKAVQYSPLISVRSVGVQDYYDMHVPGWVNYVGNGVVSHNTDTILAFGSWKDIQRAQRLGKNHYREYWSEGADRAYTLQWLLVMRMGMFVTDRKVGHEISVVDGAPYRIGQQGYGHFYIGDRVGSTIRGMKPGRIFVDQVTEVALEWSRDKAAQWRIILGHKEPTDPVIEAFEKLQEILGILHDFGVL